MLRALCLWRYDAMHTDNMHANGRGNRPILLHSFACDHGPLVVIERARVSGFERARAASQVAITTLRSACRKPLKAAKRPVVLR